MDTLKKFAFIIILIISAGCTGNDNKTMDKAEALMQDNPKKALLLLDSLKQNSIKGNHSNARFALLYSMALDKNYIDVTDDSLICIAEDWYSRKGDVREKFLSYYYKGVVNSNAKKYPEAITAFSQAQKYEDQINDNYLLGLLYNQMGYIYKIHYDYKRSLDAFKKAYTAYDSSNKENHKNYLLLRIASVYWNLNDYVNSEYFYNKAIKEGELTGYDILVELSVADLISLYIEQHKYAKAQMLFDKYNVKITSKRPKFAGGIALLHYVNSNPAKGKEILATAWKYAKDKEDSCILYLHEYRINKELKETKLALESLEKGQKLQDQSINLKLQLPILEIQKNLLEKDLEHTQYKLRTDKQIIWLCSILAFIAFSVTLYMIRIWKKKKDLQIAGYLDLLNELQHRLQHMQNEITHKNIKLDSAHSNAKEIIAKRLDLINNLSTTLYEKQNSPKAKEIFIKEVKSIVENFCINDEDLKWMELLVNESNNNLLQNLYDIHPSLSETDKRLLCYIYAGFSSKSISVFLNIPIETVYNRKSRILAKTGLSKAQNKITNTCKIPS